MESSITNLMLCTLPENLKEEGSKLIGTMKTVEEERLKSHGHKYRRHRYSQRSRTTQEEETEEEKMKRKTKADKAAIPLAIARLVMEVWSPVMKRHAEKLLLQKAVNEQYLTEHLLKWVHVLEESGDAVSESGWLIQDQDEAIIELLWDVFNVKEHFHQVYTHRLWIQRSYDRLKEFLPGLPAEIIERHDLSKFAFSQAIGYTLKWVHGTYHQIWKDACDLHLHNEPHHPETWSKLYTPEEKRKKLQVWLKDVCDFQSGCPYGIDVTNLDLHSEDLAEPFLLESFVDMVGIEWERKKGQRLDITTRELVYMDDRFLCRYSKKQHEVISNLIKHVLASDNSWNTVVLSDRENFLLTTVPENSRPVCVCEMDIQKRYEERRLIKLAVKDQQKNNEETTSADDVLTNSMERKAHDIAFLIMICKVVSEHWGKGLRKQVEDTVLKKAIDEKFITNSQVKWVMVFENHGDTGNITHEAVEVNIEAIAQLLWEDFNLREHFKRVQTHRYWVKQSYLRLAHFMPELSEEVIERHDLTKFSLSQSLGYALKWVHDINHAVWRKACDLHLNSEPHHPQMWSRKHTSESKQSCLENWLCVKAGGPNYGTEIALLDLSSENMARVFLLESLLDMVAVEWERNKGQRPDLTYTELIYMEDRFLSRYTASDKEFILNLMSEIRQADSSSSNQ